MPWLTLAMIAASALSKHAQEQNAIRDASQDTALNIERENAASLGGKTYGAQVGQTALNISRMKRDEGPNQVGQAIQAIGALDKAGSSSSDGKDYGSDPKFRADNGGYTGSDVRGALPTGSGDYSRDLKKALGQDDEEDRMYA